MKRQEQVLFYRFQDEDKLAVACKTLHKLGIITKVLPADAWREKVGYLLGAKGFQPAKSKGEDDFVFPHEVMVLQNIRNKRLDEVLMALKDAGVPHIRFKAVVTPFNTLWTLRRLCETMQREHGALTEREKVE
ncbi:protein of unknown function [Selenomonas ruminantium]|uniref:DUF3783 domain-containing protein n=1 Tax=Selenomonas ruminantium TaxID=971 RepID=A0A1M6WJ10_SELRU|nr:DUF3783 domain-containing protein [Selenomonas ruminantium]SHK93697.1 protein of unknown function [Selenomonas ruminantium]